ncbi:acyl carrier protein [Sesbania bispinosa]|nr:acyl carrier protein [Sesbania bispinosa]
MGEAVIQEIGLHIHGEDSSMALQMLGDDIGLNRSDEDEVLATKTRNGFQRQSDNSCGTQTFTHVADAQTAVEKELIFQSEHLCEVPIFRVKDPNDFSQIGGLAGIGVKKRREDLRNRGVMKIISKGC